LARAWGRQTARTCAEDERLCREPTRHRWVAMQTEITPPKVFVKAFTCPHCRAYANQLWGNARLAMIYGDNLAHHDNEHGPRLGKQHAVATYELDGLYVAHCFHCEKLSVWIGSKMVWPVVSVVAPPNEDLPQGIREDYLEAAAILQHSPRGAAALLRLAVQK